MAACRTDRTFYGEQYFLKFSVLFRQRIQWLESPHDVTDDDRHQATLEIYDASKNAAEGFK